MKQPGAGSVVHPKGVLDGRSGPIVLGKGNVVEELAVIRNTTGAPLVIGDNNWFCVGSVVESARIGTGNVVEAKGVESSLCLLPSHFTFSPPSHARGRQQSRG